MTYLRLRLVAHLALAVLLIANGPVAAALAATLPARPTHDQDKPCSCCCEGEEAECDSGCPCCSRVPPSATDHQPAATTEGDESAPGKAGCERPCPCCPSCPHGSQGPDCCNWCGAAKAPCCLDTHFTLDADPDPGSPLSEHCLLSLHATPNELFHPPRA